MYLWDGTGQEGLELRGSKNFHNGGMVSLVHQTPTTWPQALHPYPRITLVDNVGADAKGSVLAPREDQISVPKFMPKIAVFYCLGVGRPHHLLAGQRI